MNTRSPEHASNQVALLGPAEIRDLAEQLDLQPTKKLGQNFVHDPNTVRMIVSSADVTADDSIVEIGPGLGSLTLALLELGAQVTAVEIDERLAQKLPHTVHDRAESVEDHLTIIHKDALQVTQEHFTQAGVPEPTALVANLPYNVSVPVLLHFLEEFPSIRRVLVMVQDEVADRLAATPGSKVYGVPSVKASYYGTVSKAGKIGKNVFWPAPKIDSGLVGIDMHDPTHAWTVDPEQRGTLFPIIDAAFGQRRKTLRAALSGYFGSAGRAEEALRIAGISPQQRGEKLSVEDFIRLADAAYDLAAAQGDQNED